MTVEIYSVTGKITRHTSSSTTILFIYNFFINKSANVKNFSCELIQGVNSKTSAV